MAESHPIAAFFHVAFKAAAVIWYIICTWVTGDSFVINFVVSIVLLAADFWTTKNVTGRKLVGLRWWNERTEGNEGAWRFESLPEGAREILPSEKRTFWIFLVAAPLAWLALALAAFFSFSWDYLIIPIIGIVMSSSNLIGYFKCSREAKSQLQNMGTKIMTGAMQQGFNNALNRV